MDTKVGAATDSHTRWRPPWYPFPIEVNYTIGEEGTFATFVSSSRLLWGNEEWKIAVQCVEQIIDLGEFLYSVLSV